MSGGLFGPAAKSCAAGQSSKASEVVDCGEFVWPTSNKAAERGERSPELIHLDIQRR